MIPMNFYVWSALGTVLIIAISQVDFGPMKVHEQRALKTGEVSNPENKKKVDTIAYLPVSDAGKISDLLVPIGTLFIGTLIAIYVSGFIRSEERRVGNE